MSDTIRELIISAGEARLADILAIKGFNTDCGTTVYRSWSRPSSIPCAVYWPGEETYSYDEYGQFTASMSFTVEGFVENGATSKAEMAEKILGDLTEAIFGARKTYSFADGATEVEAGDTLTGDSSGATGHVESVSVASGTWAGGDAAGTVVLRRVVGTFEAEEINAASLTIDPDFTYTDPETAFAGGYGRLAIVSGGVETYPDEDKSYVGGKLEGVITYETYGGNPYGQPS